MRSAARVVALGVALIGGGCNPPAIAPHYEVGLPYEEAGAWHYPHENFAYDATGLATRLPDRRGPTANGETYDSRAMAGAHPTLQLPAIVRVTNLENGRRIRVRVNDRGPGTPARLIGLTRQAADLIGLPAGRAARVRVEVESGPSQALRDRLQGGPKGIVPAPVGAVMAETLAPPGASRIAPPRVVVSPPPPTPAADVPDGLPATFEEVQPVPGRLWLNAGQFSQSAYANVVETKLSPLPVQIRREAGARSNGVVVMVGPFDSVAAADAALDQARSAGVTDAVIVVE